MDEYKFAYSVVDSLINRRQATTTFYLSVNTGILAVIGLLIKDAQLIQVWLIISLIILLVAGMLACWIWFNLLKQYEALINWWYSRLRELEVSFPNSSQLITREYKDLYQKNSSSAKLGMTRRECLITYIFFALYLVFVVGLVFTLIFK